MRSLQKERHTDVNAGSMADIAFLLLIFFLVTTTIATDKGIFMKLPIKDNEVVNINERNIFNVLINSNNELLAENEVIPLIELKEKVKVFIDNNGVDINLSDSPKKAIVSIKTDRGTKYEVYLSIIDEILLGYRELRAKHLGISLETYLQLDSKIPEDKKLLKVAREAYPMQISDAEPVDISSMQ